MNARGRLPIRRVRRVIPGRLDPAERDRLCDQLYALWSLYFVGLSRERFVETHILDDTRLHLLYGEGDELAGFLNINVHRVGADGRTCTVMASGAFTRLEYSGVREMGLCLLREALRLRLAHPWSPIAWVGVATSPVSYRALGQWIERFYPGPDQQTPPAVEAMMLEVTRRRSLEVASADPWITRFPLKQRQVNRLQGSRSLQGSNRYVNYYLQRSPDWSEGRCLQVWVPIDLGNALRGLARALTGRRRR